MLSKENTDCALLLQAFKRRFGRKLIRMGDWRVLLLCACSLVFSACESGPIINKRNDSVAPSGAEAISSGLSLSVKDYGDKRARYVRIEEEVRTLPLRRGFALWSVEPIDTAGENKSRELLLVNTALGTQRIISLKAELAEAIDHLETDDEALTLLRFFDFGTHEYRIGREVSLLEVSAETLGFYSGTSAESAHQIDWLEGVERFTYVVSSGELYTSMDGVDVDRSDLTELGARLSAVKWGSGKIFFVERDMSVIDGLSVSPIFRVRDIVNTDGVVIRQIVYSYNIDTENMRFIPPGS